MSNQRHTYRQTIRVNSATVSMTAQMTHDEAWHWMLATGYGLRDYASYAVSVEYIS